MALPAAAVLFLAACGDDVGATTAPPEASPTTTVGAAGDESTESAPDEETASEETSEATSEAPAEEDAADDTAEEEVTGQQTGDEPAADDGDETGSSRDNPLPLGQQFTVGDWQVTITSATLDATDVVLDENQFNEPPVDGRQFVLVEVEATYNGDETGLAWLDLDFSIVGSGGNTFSYGVDDYCGVVPGDLLMQSEQFAGATVTGNVCFSVTSDQVDGAVVSVSEMMDWTGDVVVFVALT